MKEESLKFVGTVTEVLGNTMFRVVLENDVKIVAYIGGKIRKHEVNIAAGDSVSVEVSPYDLSKGRIVYRN